MYPMVNGFSFIDVPPPTRDSKFRPKESIYDFGCPVNNVNPDPRPDPPTPPKTFGTDGPIHDGVNCTHEYPGLRFNGIVLGMNYQTLNYTDTLAGNVTGFNYLSFRDARGWPRPKEPVDPRAGPFIGNEDFYNERAWTALTEKCRTSKIQVCRIESSKLINYIQMEYDKPDLCPSVFTSGPAAANCFDPNITKEWINKTVDIVNGTMSHYSTMKSNDSSYPDMICSFAIETGKGKFTFGDSSLCDNKDIPLSSSSASSFEGQQLLGMGYDASNADGMAYLQFYDNSTSSVLPTDDGSGLGTGAIIGIACGGLLIFLVAGAIIFKCYKKKQNEALERNQKMSEVLYTPDANEGEAYTEI